MKAQHCTCTQKEKVNLKVLKVLFVPFFVQSQLLTLSISLCSYSEYDSLAKKEKTQNKQRKWHYLFILLKMYVAIMMI